MHLLGVFWGLFSYRGQVFSLGIRLTRLTIPCPVHSEHKLLLFSAFSARRYFGIWISFIFQIIFLVFQRTKATPYASSSCEEWTATILCIFTQQWLNGAYLICLHSVMNEQRLSYFRRLKNHHVLDFLLPFLSQYQSWSQICLSVDTYMANRVWCTPMLISPWNDRGWERDSFSHGQFSLLLSSVDSCRLPSSADGQMY